MKTVTGEQRILDQQLAIDAYLNALLDDPAAAQTNSVTAEPAADEARAPAERVHIFTSPTVTVADIAVPRADAVDSRGVPAWAGERFQAQLFEVAGLTLAVPLVKLTDVVAQAGEMAPLSGHSPLFAGQTDYRELPLRVVDTARLVLPAERVARLSGDPTSRCRSLVVVDEGRWALAGSSIGAVIELESSAVRWRGGDGKRLWLAGTVIERMCALLDIDQLSRVLAAASD